MSFVLVKLVDRVEDSAYALIKLDSLLLSVPPRHLGRFSGPVMHADWISVDDISIILHSVIVQSAHALVVFNVASEPQSWNVLIDAVRELDPAAVANVIPLPDWVDRLRKLSNSTSEDIKNLPALRLLDFYEGLGRGRNTSTLSQN